MARKTLLTGEYIEIQTLVNTVHTNLQFNASHTSYATRPL